MTRARSCCISGLARTAAYEEAILRHTNLKSGFGSGSNSKLKHYFHIFYRYRYYFVLIQTPIAKYQYRTGIQYSLMLLCCHFSPKLARITVQLLVKLKSGAGIRTKIRDPDQKPGPGFGRESMLWQQSLNYIAPNQPQH